jgi:hypothetical protein
MNQNNPQNQHNQQNQNKPFQQMSQQKKVETETMGFDKYVAIALVVGLIAGFVIGQSVGSNKGKVGKNATSTNSDLVYGGEDVENDDEENSEVVENNEIEISDQKEGNSVVISNIKLDTSYWVAVRDSQSTTKVPYILGAKRVAAGNYTNMSIYVNRPTVSGKSYDIVFYKDSKAFDYSPTKIVMNGDSVAQATFQAN